ncbi:9697_t:CDS:2, partial [Paraglomus occultum]
DYVHQSNIDTPNEKLNTPLCETHTNSPCPSFETFCGSSDPCSYTTNDNDHFQHFDRQVNLQAQAHTQHFRPSASFPLPRIDGTTVINPMDYGSTGYQSNCPVPCIHPDNLNIMNGHLNRPIHNQVGTQTNSIYRSATHHSDMANNDPTDNHVSNRSVSYTITPLSTQTSLSFSSSNAIVGSRYLVTKVEKTQSV